MHYAVPAILARANVLEQLYTDTYAPRLVRAALTMASGVGPPSLRKWLGRVPVDVPEDRIHSFDRLGFEYYWRQKRATNSGSTLAPHLWAGQELCRRVINRGLGNAGCVYTFNTAGLELLQYARSRGIFTVMEQTIAPTTIQEALLKSEEGDHPRWELQRTEDPLRCAFAERERMEWEASDLILCGSEFVREGIQSSGGPADRCSVVPYGINLPLSAPPIRSRHKTLRVLTVGAVGLRKGAPYVLEAASTLLGKAEFRMVGRLDITSYAQGLLNSKVNLLGAVPRSEIHRQFEWADIFLLPSICEGSATVCYEALAHGLPVITTPNAGSVVRDGVDGFIVPIRNSEAIVDRIERFADNSDLLALMSSNALERAAEYTLDKYGERLLAALSGQSGLHEIRNQPVPITGMS
jgi:hypothetical protein